MNFSARKAALTSSFLLFGLGSVFPAYACWAEIGQRYNINPYLLGAIAKTESNFKANAVRQNKNGTRDIGVMQINLYWHWNSIKDLDVLDPTTNVLIAAQLLRDEMKKSNGNIP